MSNIDTIARTLATLTAGTLSAGTIPSAFVSAINGLTGAFTATGVRPSTQPRTDANAFTLGATNTNHGRALISAFSDLPSSGVTIEGWVQSYQTTPNTLFGGDHTTNSNFTAEAGTTYPSVTLNANAFQSVSTISAFAPTYGMSWNHVAAVYDGSYQYLYWNGVLMVRQANTGSIRWTNGTTPMFVVARKQAGGQFIGGMSRIFLSNVARSQSYCRSVYAAGLLY
jgi:hypothetical protein